MLTETIPLDAETYPALTDTTANVSYDDKTRELKAFYWHDGLDRTARNVAWSNHETARETLDRETDRTGTPDDVRIARTYSRLGHTMYIAVSIDAHPDVLVALDELVRAEHEYALLNEMHYSDYVAERAAEEWRMYIVDVVAERLETAAAETGVRLPTAGGNLPNLPGEANSARDKYERDTDDLFIRAYEHEDENDWIDNVVAHYIEHLKNERAEEDWDTGGSYDLAYLIARDLDAGTPASNHLAERARHIYEHDTGDTYITAYNNNNKHDWLMKVTKYFTDKINN